MPMGMGYGNDAMMGKKMKKMSGGSMPYDMHGNREAGKSMSKSMGGMRSMRSEMDFMGMGGQPMGY